MLKSRRDEELMTLQEAAAFLRLPDKTLYTWRAKGVGPRGYRVGKHVRYRLEEIESWLSERAAP